MVKFYVAEACYIIGETKRILETSLKEPKSAGETDQSAMAEHG